MRKLIIAIGALALTACASKKIGEFNPDSDFDIFVDSGYCFGDCPVYTLKVNQDGQAIYDGSQFTELRGKHTRELSKSEMDSLKLILTENNFFELDSAYNNPYATDMQTFIVSVDIKDGDSHRVMGRVDPPQELLNIQAFIERLRKRNFSK